MKKTVLVFLLLASVTCLKSQIAGSYSVPGSFSSLAAVINTLNVYGVSAAVTINIAANYTETVPNGGLKLRNPAGSSYSNTILFRKSGAGANPLLFAYTGGTATGSDAIQDGIWSLAGCQYITIDAIDLSDLNTSSPATMEYGYAFFKDFGTGNKNNVIKNCVITLAGAMAAPESRGIDLSAADNTSNASTVTVISTGGINSYNGLYSNLIKNCNTGISVAGYPGVYYNDVYNDIGGASAATGNTLTNIGGGSWWPYCINAANQASVNISYNIIDNGVSTGSATIPTTDGINVYSSYATGAVVSNNTINLSYTSVGGARHGINLYGGGTATISGNLFPVFNYSTASGGTAIGHTIIATENLQHTTISNNRMNSAYVSSGNLCAISVNNVTTAAVNSNTISALTLPAGVQGYLLGIFTTAYYSLVQNNVISGMTGQNSAITYVIPVYSPSGADSMAVLNNTISNMKGNYVLGIELNAGLRNNSKLRVVGNSISNFSFVATHTTESTQYGIDAVAHQSTGTVVIASNTVSSFYGKGLSVPGNNGGLVVGLRGFGTKCTIFKNKVYNLNSSGEEGVRGLMLDYSPCTYDVFNNVVGDLNVTADAPLYALQIKGGTHRVYFNTFYLNNSFSPYLGSSVIYLGYYATLELRNNILVNTSASTNTNIVSIIWTFGSHTVSASSNNNAYYLGSPSSTRRIYTSVPSSSVLSGWKGFISPAESQSVYEYPPFITTTGSLTNFLNISSTVPTQIEGGAVAISTITTDFVNATRSSTPDIGAWEGNFMPPDLLMPVITSSAFATPPCVPGTRTFTMHVTDASGVAGGTLSPRLYYRVNSGAYSSTQGSLTSGTDTNGVWTFSLSYTASAGDVIGYFLALQDASSSNNAILAPSNGTITDVNNILVSPSPPFNYTLEAFPSVSLSASAATVCAGSSYTMGLAGAYAYNISPGGSAIVSPSSNTTFTISGTSSLGCVSTNTVQLNLTVSSLPTITVNSGTICAGSQVFTLAPSGAVSYSYQGGSNTVTVFGHTTFTVVGYNSNGCASAPVTSSVYAMFAYAYGIATPSQVCYGDSVRLIAYNSISANWSGNMVNNSPFSATASAVYTLSSISSNGCPSTEQVSVVVNPLPTVSVAVNAATICAGNSFTLQPSGAFQYSISPGSSTLVTPFASHAYTITGVSVFSCASSNTAYVNITVSQLPVISVPSGTICQGNIFTITPSGASSYSIQGGSATVSPQSTSSYTVSGTNFDGCRAASPAVVTVTVLLPTIGASASTLHTCYGSQVTLNGTGGGAYVWSDGIVNNTPFTGTATNNYTVTGVSSNGCQGTNTILITIYPLPTVTVNSGTICYGQSFTLVPIGAASYVFEGGAAVVNPQVTSSYTVSGISSQGCKSSSSATSTVMVFFPTISASVSPAQTCYGTPVIFSAHGGSGYTWNGGVTNNVPFTPIASDVYSVSGTSSNGCPGTASVHITVYPLPVVKLNAPADTVCIGDEIILTASGADSYDWSPLGAPDSVLRVEAVANTIVFVKGTGQHGCSAIAQAVINVSECVGMIEATIKGYMTLAPNPAGRSFTILNNTSGTNVSVKIFDVQGRLVFFTDLEFTEQTVDVASLSKGLYTVAFYNAGKLLKRSKLIISGE
jgi:hypothetical protein